MSGEVSGNPKGFSGRLKMGALNGEYRSDRISTGSYSGSVARIDL